MKILIVDDSRAMRRIVQRALRQAGFGGHEVVEAEDGAQGLEIIRNSPPDIVLCDWNMPNMNGIDLLKTIRAEGNQIPFGFVTSERTDEIQQEANAAGANFHVFKPFKADDIQSAIGPFLS